MDAATELNIVVTNVPDYCLDEVSGRAIAMMLALAYKIVPLNQAVKEGKFADATTPNLMQKIVNPVFRTRGQTLGLIGCSKIGTATALKATGLGMRIIAYDPYLFSGALESLGIEPVDMNTLLKESDFVSMHVPANPETKNLLGYEQFRKMKPTAYVINTARGMVIDEPALVRALQEGLIAGAGLDVTIKEPVEKDNPLTKFSNVILTGHSAWYSNTADAELFFIKPISQIILARQGQWPPYAINPQVRKKWLEKWGKTNL
jgi:D-3-phosphoglycerate dehydrogenase